MSRIFEMIKEAEQRRAMNMRAAQVGLCQAETPGQQSTVANQEPPVNKIFTDATERRKQQRTRMNLLVRLRPAESKDRNFEEVLETLNACRANLYVMTARKSYYEQMRLRTMFPYVSAHDRASMAEDDAQVVRIDHLPDGRLGLAILFQRSIRTTPVIEPIRFRSESQPVKERRLAMRHAVSATAAVTDLRSQTRIEARCSDLSAAGCYIDTLNPFPESARVQLHLFNENKELLAAARVITNHIGMGMGLAFEGLAAEQASALADWLADNDAVTVGFAEPSLAPEISIPSEPSASSDRALILKLMRVLQANGKLTQAEMTALLSDSFTG